MSLWYVFKSLASVFVYVLFNPKILSSEIFYSDLHHFLDNVCDTPDVNYKSLNLAIQDLLKSTRYKVNEDFNLLEAWNKSKMPLVTLPHETYEEFMSRAEKYYKGELNV